MKSMLPTVKLPSVLYSMSRKNLKRNKGLSPSILTLLLMMVIHIQHIVIKIQQRRDLTKLLRLAKFARLLNANLM